MDTNSKKYRTILADPPWDINQRGNYGAIKHYDLMSLERIKAMPVADLCENNAHLYLWCPNGPIYWIKPRLGLGVYIRNASETCLFATKGRSPVKTHSQPNWMFCPQLSHSEKPGEQFAIIERLSDGPYLELFARRRQPGWDCWGFEAPGGSDIVIPGYPVPAYSEKVINPDKRKEV